VLPLYFYNVEFHKFYYQPIQAEELGILNSSLYIDIYEKGIGEMGKWGFFMRHRVGYLVHLRPGCYGSSQRFGRPQRPSNCGGEHLHHCRSNLLGCCCCCRLADVKIHPYMLVIQHQALQYLSNDGKRIQYNKREDPTYTIIIIKER
jgi:hypothetical protein